MNDDGIICVLASQSPNRLKLLQQIGLKNIKVHVSNYEEDLPKTLSPQEFVTQTAYWKLKKVVDELLEKEEKFTFVIAADTIIEFNGEIIGKPENAQNAVETLKRLRNETHNVYTGVAIYFEEHGTIEMFSEKSVVHFGDIPDRVIQQYVDSGEPLKKAGSYGIGEFGAVFVRSIEGCQPNVVGLPLHRVHQVLLARKVL
ncbi:unnamed protein product [Caenorhabditis angaria]|uniref:Uncharacterized protein n=1 Tax=Caenorhabditis angaria TaxID=860376 RepID=A0A9P1I8M1_9PELO|nr:unnamed protein product [Caenorhabditis angaria]